MPFGTLEEVQGDVRCCTLDVAKGGGHVLNSVHNVQGDVSLGNIITMSDEIYAIGTILEPDRRITGVVGIGALPAIGALPHYPTGAIL